jgi:hypothetical protein
MGDYRNLTGMEPSAACYNGLLKAIVMSRAADAGEQVEGVLRGVMPRSGPGSPDVVTYTICIRAWQQSDRRDAADRAEELLKECMALSEAAPERDLRSRLQPNAKTFLAYLRLLLKSDDEGILERVERAMTWIMELGIRPNHDLRKAIAETFTVYLRTAMKSDRDDKVETVERVGCWLAELGIGRPSRDLWKAMTDMKRLTSGTSVTPRGATDEER